jgi:hypothetical protein
MARTALDLTAEEWRSYRPGRPLEGRTVAERWQRAWEVARRAADLLRERFGATRVVAFGSLAHRGWFTSWSDLTFRDQCQESALRAGWRGEKL